MFGNVQFEKTTQPHTKKTRKGCDRNKAFARPPKQAPARPTATHLRLGFRPGRCCGEIRLLQTQRQNLLHQALGNNSNDEREKQNRSWHRRRQRGYVPMYINQHSCTCFMFLGIAGWLMLTAKNRVTSVAVFVESTQSTISKQSTVIKAHSATAPGTQAAYDISSDAKGTKASNGSAGRMQRTPAGSSRVRSAHVRGFNTKLRRKTLPSGALLGETAAPTAAIARNLQVGTGYRPRIARAESTDWASGSMCSWVRYVSQHLAHGKILACCYFRTSPSAPRVARDPQSKTVPLMVHGSTLPISLTAEFHLPDSVSPVSRFASPTVAS